MCGANFVITKEQRNRFLVVGIDGHNKLFSAFHYYMPSKEVSAYNWDENCNKTPLN